MLLRSKFDFVSQTYICDDRQQSTKLILIYFMHLYNRIIKFTATAATTH